MSRILIFANGDLPNPVSARGLMHAEDFILAVDGGTRHVLALGRVPDVAVGDLDSITSDDQTQLERLGVKVVKHPREKDQTDLELAMDLAISRKPSKIVILAALGGRLDHALGNIGLLADPRLNSIETSLDDGMVEVLLCQDDVKIVGKRGDPVSLIPWRGDAAGVSTENLKWELADEPLFQDRTRGISNEMLDETASVRVRSGMLLVIHCRLKPAGERKGT